MTLSAMFGPLVLLSLAAALWLWAGTSSSLAALIQGVNWVLPANQRLQAREVTGNLHQGGHIGHMEWEKNGLRVAIEQVHVQLDWSRLWSQAWPITAVRLGALHIDDQSPPQARSPALSQLSLPVPVQLAWQIDRLSWQNKTAPVITGLRGHYAYDGAQHTLTLDDARMAKGRYTLQAQLQALAPMALDLHIQGHIDVPDGWKPAGMALELQTTVQGSLAGELATLAVQAQIQPTLADPSVRHATPAQTRTPPTEAMALQLQAKIQPWQAQKVVQAHLQAQALDLALVWPHAPQTRLSGQTHIVPDKQGWSLDSQWKNSRAGAWDQHRLPLSQLALQAHYQQGLWTLSQAHAQLASGQIQGAGQQTAQGWTGHIELKGLVPEQLHTALSGPPVYGQLQAREAGTGHIELQAELTAHPPTSAPPSPSASHMGDALPWQQLQLQALWQAQEWDIRSLTLVAAQARLNAQFKYQPQPQSVHGTAQLSLPGLQAQLNGALSPAQGQGHLDVQLQDAKQSLGWLQRLPGLANTLQGLQASGTGQLRVDWQGGFKQPDTAIRLAMSTPRLQYSAPKTSPWQLKSGQFELQGTLKELQAQADVGLTHGNDSFRLSTAFAANRSHPTEHHWRGQIQNFRVEATTPAAPKAWQLELQKPWLWQSQPAQGGLQWEAANWRVQGPTPGQARLLSEAGFWHASTDTGASQSQAAVQWSDLPLSWIPGLNLSDLHNDVLLKGQWTLRKQAELNMSAFVQRSQGDLRIQTENAPNQRLPAGLREARLDMTLNGTTLDTGLTWDSEHMGSVKAKASTQVMWSSEGFQWAAQAPVQGTIEADLPQVGAWSLLAPPGWRMQGTLAARLALSGTRQQAHWQGLLQADNLALRSVVQGIEFSQGQLLAKLQGQQLILERLSLRGAGAQGGELQAQGQLGWSLDPAGFDLNKPMNTAKLRLQIQAKALRVSNRADRRLAVSGDVTAEMDKGQLRLTGLVQADQALFILPEQSTPSLGNDVRVLRSDAPVSTKPPSTATPSGLPVPDVQIRLDLGSDFQVQGQGIDTRLVGQVLLVSNATTRGQPRLTGQVHTEGGRYKAYGQQMDIDTGVLRFNGAYDNPNLDIIALRPNLSQRVGVQVSGTALLPRIRLYADPDMPDADKLAWLVLGRSAASGGAESAVLQQAALVLLSGNGKTLNGELANSLGLDEISLASGSRSDATATGAAVTLGKRLSKDFYMAYESSLSGTFGSLYIFYDLSRRLTLRAQAGQQSALDLIFTVRQD